MSWKIDDIDFKTYGVSVYKSAGVLDMPRMVDTSNDWLDRNGRDYWQPAEDVKYQEREITLNCYIKATGYEQFKTKVLAFYAALFAPGERTLLTPFGNSISGIIVQDAISMVRRTQYVSSQQIGMFQLRLTVKGDSQTNIISLYTNFAGTPTLRRTLKYGRDAKLTRALMSSDQIAFDCELNASDVDHIGNEDFIYWNSTPYILFGYPVIKKMSGNKFVYSFVFQHIFFKLKDIGFLVNGESSTYLWGNMADILALVVENGNRLFPGMFAVGSSVSTINKNHQFQDEYSFDVLSRICTEYDVEFSYTYAEGVITIDVVEKVGADTTPVVLAYGDGIKTITRDSEAREKFVTHLYAYGSSKNLPLGYRSTRLSPVTQPLVLDFYGIKREMFKTWDDIKPERTGTISAYTYTAPTSADDPSTATYEITDPDMFDLNKLDLDGNTVYFISGTTAKIDFISGDMAGFEFEVLSYNHTTKTFKLTPLKQANGQYYPNADLFPAAGDKYKIIDINLPQLYVDDAEERLRVRGQEWLDYYYNPATILNCDLEERRDNTTLTPGDRITVNEPEFWGMETLRVIELTYGIYSRECSVKLSDVLRISNLAILKKKVNEVQKVLSSVAISEVNEQRRSDKTVGELSNKLINPLDEKLNADSIIRRQSLDPIHLSLDASTPQVSVAGGLVSTTGTSVIIEAGVFYSHNYNAKTRRDIENDV